MSRITLTTLHKMAHEGEKIAALTCYDASFAQLLESAGVDLLLVGDSLGMVLQGRESTLPVTLDEMIYHTRCVARGAKKAFIVADMPFGSYQENPQDAFGNAARLMGAGAHMVKIEGGSAMVETARFLVERGIPVFGHLGLTPQSVHQLGGYRVQGKTAEGAQRLLADAHALHEAGIGLLLLECIPAVLAREVTQAIPVPTIGIGAGPDCSGQVLVLYDMLGIYGGKVPKFAKNFMDGADGIQAAVASYVRAVKAGGFPAAEHGFD
jgi:3-methyl-2-oxobutanoate hydroxymethyltransferase